MTKTFTPDPEFQRQIDRDTKAGIVGQQHTPGPWRVARSQGGKYYVYGADNRPIFIPNVSATGRNNLEMQANDCLIAAAPNLKGQLREMCFKADSAIRYLQSAYDGLTDVQAKGYLGGFIQEFMKRTEEAWESLAEAKEPEAFLRARPKSEPVDLVKECGPIMGAADSPYMAEGRRHARKAKGA